MKKVYYDLNKSEKNGCPKAVNIYGRKVGLELLSYLYTEIHKNNTKQMGKHLDIVIGMSREEFSKIYDLARELEKKYNKGE